VLEEASGIDVCALDSRYRVPAGITVPSASFAVTTIADVPEVPPPSELTTDVRTVGVNVATAP